MSLTRRQTSPARMRSYDPEAEFSQRRPSQQHSSFMSKGVNHLRLSAEPSSRSRGTTSQLRESDTKCLFPPPRRTPTAPSQSDYNSDSQYGATNGYSQDLTQSSIFLRQGRLHSTSAPEQSVPVSGFSYPHIALSDDNDWSNSRQSGQTRAQTWDANCLNSSFLSAQRATAPNGMSFYNSQNPDSSYSQLSRQPSSYVQQQGHRQDLSHSNKSPQDPGGSYGSIMALDEVGTSYSSNHAFTGHDQTRSTLSVPRLGDSYYFPQSRESPRPRAIIGEPAQDNSPPRQISQVVPSPKSQAPTPSLTIPPPQITVSLDKNFGASNFSGYTRSAPPSPSPRGRLRKAHFVEEKQQGNTLVVPGSQQREKKGRARSHSTRVLTDEGRQHANEMRKLRACPSCHQKKVKCTHKLERDIMNARSPTIESNIIDLPDDSFYLGDSFYDTSSPNTQPPSPWPSADHSSYNLLPYSESLYSPSICPTSPISRYPQPVLSPFEDNFNEMGKGFYPVSEGQSPW